MLISKTSSSLVMLVILLAFHPSVFFGQTNNSHSTVFKIEVNKPDMVLPSETFSFEIIADNMGHYSGPVNVTLMLPQGFVLSKPDAEHYKFSFDGHEYSIYSEKPNTEDRFTLNLQFRVGNVSPALYMFFGTISFKDDRIAFNEILAVGSDGKREAEVPELVTEKGITISYNQAENAKSGDDFRFVTTLKKPVDYSVSGQLKHSFTKGFTPLYTEIAGCDFALSDNEVTISWQKMALGEEVTICYLVKVGQISGGVYPVLTSYSDDSGFAFKKNIGIVVENRKSADVASQIIADIPIYKVSLDLPGEVRPNETFATTVLVQKGKNTGPGTIELNFPPDFEIEAPEDLNYKFYRSTGKMIITWSAMPANPAFETHLTITSSNLQQAVYPVNACFIIEGRVLAEYFTHLYITNTKTPAQTGKTFTEMPLEIPEIDTTSLFSKIDNLLNEWKSTTNNTLSDKSKPRQDTIQKKIVPPETQLANSKSQIENTTTQSSSTMPPKEGIKKMKFFYGVQIKASHVQLTNLETSLSAIGIDQPLNENADGEWYRYTVGEFSTLQEAKSYLSIVKSKGFADAFVAEFLNGKRGRIH